MKKTLSLLMIGLLMQFSLSAQDFVLNNPVMTPNPGIFPGGSETMTFDFYVAGASYTFSSNDLSNDYATITFSFTKMNPTGHPPTGTGAALFTWVLSNNGATGTSLVYTWTGRSKDVIVNQTPPQPKYKIIFSNVPITAQASQSQSDVRVAGQFTDPGNAPTGNSGNNSAVIATYTAVGSLPITLNEFVVTKNNCTANLNWKTSSEVNSDRFEIEVSTGTNPVYGFAGTVYAAGSSSTTKSYLYSFPMQAGVVYYFRLKMIDKNGSFVYSNIQSANCSKGNGGIEIAPNPAKDHFTIKGMEVGRNFILIYSANGQLVKTQDSKLNNDKVIISNLAPGTYMVKITNEKSGNTVVSKLIKY